MKFDVLRVIGCAVEPAAPCTSEGPGIDDRCKDPAFAALHPEICPNSPRLIVKPDKLSICKNAATQLRAYLVTGGGEQLLSVGVTWTSNNPGVLVIGATSGNATGIAPGIATVTAAWEGYLAVSQVTIVDSTNCCADASVGMVVAIDNSLSMKSLFEGYGTKLDFAKFAGDKLAGDLNTTKDKMAVEPFNQSGTIVQSLTTDITALQAAIAGIGQTSNHTNLYDALDEAIAHLNTQAFDKKVIFLITDGENKIGTSPIQLADDFKSAGGIIVVLGVRAHGTGFALLSQLATGGMFINSYVGIGEAAIETVRGLKGYFCAGNCTPPGNEIVNMPQLTYENFLQWDVLGPVDLIGGTPPYAQYDFLPGHGLYVDTNGSGPPWLGHMRSKETLSFVSSMSYEVKIRLAGNQRSNAGTYTTRFKIDGVFEEAITMDWNDDFTEFTFIIPLNEEERQGKFEMISECPVGPYGNLWDYIRIKEEGGLQTIILEDNFDNENPQFIAPACGYAPIPSGYPGFGGYAYGYSCYDYGCLSEPPGQQQPDPSPVPDLEE